jgi:hypothetical protein
MRTGRKTVRRGTRGDAGLVVERLEDRRLLSGGQTFGNGASNAMAMDASGKLYIAYYDKASQHLKYSIREASGAWSTHQAVLDDGSSEIGLEVSMALDSAGNPGVVYRDAAGADLKYAHWNGSTWDKQVVGGSAGRLGYYPSLAYVSDKPTISHFVRTSPNGSPSAGYLRVDQGVGVNPPATGWSNKQIDTGGGDAGRFSSIAYNAVTQKWGISYDDNAQAKFAESATSSVTGAWTATGVPGLPSAAAGGAFWTSLVYDNLNQPAFAYYHSTEYNVHLARRTTSGWTTYNVDGNNTTGKYPNLFHEGSGTFRVAYYDDTADAVEVQVGSNTSWARVMPDLATDAGNELKVIRRNGTTIFACQHINGGLFLSDDQTGVNWTKESGATAFVGRRQFATAVFDAGAASNKGPEMWVIGGQTGSLQVDSVRASNNGIDWRAVRDSGAANGFGARSAHAAVAFAGKLWVIGGQSGSQSTKLGDVWSSPDGQTWTRATHPDATFVDVGARAGHSAVVYDGRMWVIGGQGPAVNGQATTPAPAVAYSYDGVTWTDAGVPAGVANRYGGSAVVYDEDLYVLGGNELNSATALAGTYKFDGTSWAQVGTAAPGVGLILGGASVYDNKIWYVTGLRALWSTNGLDWTAAADDPDVGPGDPFDDSRSGVAALTFALPSQGPRLWLLGGYVNGQNLDEVWSTT